MVVRVAPLDSTHSLHLSNEMQPSNVPSLCFTQRYNIHHLSQSHHSYHLSRQDLLYKGFTAGKK